MGKKLFVATQTLKDFIGDVKPIETYKCTDCGKEWGVDIPTWETPICTDCGDHGSVIETTDTKAI